MYVTSVHEIIETLLTNLTKGLHTFQTQRKWGKFSFHWFSTFQVRYGHVEWRSYYKKLKEDVFIAVQQINYISQIHQCRAESCNTYDQGGT